MKLGLIVRQDYGGLAFQTHALHKLLKPYRTLVVDSTPFNGFKQHDDWYKDATHKSNGFISDELARDFLSGLDAVLTCEVPYNDNLYAIARSMGVKTILQPNAELNPHFTNRRLDKPDVFILPSKWYQADTQRLGVLTYVCPPPIDIAPETIYKHKEHGKLKVLHVKGKKAAYDRNGSDIVAAINIDGVDIHIHDQLENPVEDMREVYEQGYDLMLLPRKYGGLCLPMYESLGYGLPVVMTNVDPNNKVLPQEWLVNFVSRRMVRTKRSILAYEVNRSKLNDKLIQFRDMDNETFQVEKLKAKNLYQDYQNGLDYWFKILEEIIK